MCLLCGDKSLSNLGEFLSSLNCHYLCVKFASGITKKNVPPTDGELVREVVRSQKLTCAFCKMKGASVNCSIKQCPLSYHLNCGISNGSLNQYDEFVSYCSTHRPLPLLPPYSHLKCYMCSLSVTPENWVSCPTCGQGLHLNCQFERARLGLVDCPACHESKKFKKEMLLFGIWFRNSKCEISFINATKKPPTTGINFLVEKLFAEDLAASSLRLEQCKMESVRNETNVGIKSLCLNELKSFDVMGTRVKENTSALRNQAGSNNRVMTDPDRSESSSTSFVNCQRFSSNRKPNCVSILNSLQPNQEHLSNGMVNGASDGLFSEIDELLEGNDSDVEQDPYTKSNSNQSTMFDRGSNRMVDVRYMADELEFVKSVEKGNMNKLTKKIHMSRYSHTLPSTLDFSINGRDDTSMKKLLAQSTSRRRKHLPLRERNIYHGRNWVPMTKYGLGEDEADVDSSWVNLFSKLQLEEISDINEGEKDLMILWNMHVSNYQGGGVSHLSLMLADFVSNYAHTIVDQNLYRNYVCHVNSLHQTGLISQKDMMECIFAMQGAMKILPDADKVVCKGQKEQWNRLIKEMVLQILEETVLENCAKLLSSTRKMDIQTDRKLSNIVASTPTYCQDGANNHVDQIEYHILSIPDMTHFSPEEHCKPLDKKYGNSIELDVMTQGSSRDVLCEHSHYSERELGTQNSGQVNSLRDPNLLKKVNLQYKDDSFIVQVRSLSTYLKLFHSTFANNPPTVHKTKEPEYKRRKLDGN